MEGLTLGSVTIAVHGGEGVDAATQGFLLTCQ